LSHITQGMAAQYADSSKIAARARLSGGFTIADEPWFTWVAKRLPVGPGASILDVGCGPAWFWGEAGDVLPPGVDLTLLDQSGGMVEEALERCRPLAFGKITGVTGDAAALPFPDDSFDVVVAMHMLYHVDDQPKAIAEMHRVLRPGGTLLVTTNGTDNMRELYALTTVFGSMPSDPAAAAFGFERAEALMRDQFGNAELSMHPASMRVTDPDVVYLALTSYPPGETAPPEQRAAFREKIDAAFAAGHGALDVTKQVGLLVSRKTT
jgi:SAM-dependent methyltransferase